MLKHIHLENFKSWRELDIDLAPITLLFGTNSSGKSSVMQAPLLLLQTEDQNSWDSIRFGDDRYDYVNLGSYRDVVFRHNLDAKITIKMEWALRPPNSEIRSGRVVLSYKNDEVQFEADKEKQIIEWSMTTRAALARGDKSLHYLGPLRGYPQRSYLWSGSMPKRIEADGENTIAVLVGAERAGNDLPEQVSEWLKRMELVDKFTTKALDKEKRFYETTVTIDGIETSILDVGFGISQVLPVITTLFFVPEGSIVLLEQPELHLHPSAQAHLADLFLHVAEKRHLQLIVESHSEHLLRRLQRRIAEVESPFATPDNIRMYFCQKGENGSTIEQVKVDRFGQISNWPDNFFGDITGDLEAMTFAALKGHGMVIEVVDTNVWVNIDKIPPESEAERQCILACYEWGKAFNKSGDNHKIAADISYKILREYFANIKKGGLAEQYLRTLLTQPITRIELVEIPFDTQGYAILPDKLRIGDEDDRKWVAVALKFEPPLSILNATDTDWVKEKAKLAQANIEVKELCSDYIQEKLK